MHILRVQIFQKIAEEYNVAVFVTNQMTADPGAGMTFQADPKKPVGGHILAHASTTRIMLKKVLISIASLISHR